jgi:hypothetical protein
MLKTGTAQSTHRFNLPEKGSLNGADFIFISEKRQFGFVFFCSTEPPQSGWCTEK